MFRAFRAACSSELRQHLSNLSYVLLVLPLVQMAGNHRRRDPPGAILETKKEDNSDMTGSSHGVSGNSRAVIGIKPASGHVGLTATNYYKRSEPDAKTVSFTHGFLTGRSVKFIECCHGVYRPIT